MAMNGNIGTPAPVGSGTHLQEGSDESSGPPGFEAFRSPMERSKQGINDLKSLHGLVERRQTRSQTKKAN